MNSHHKEHERMEDVGQSCVGGAEWNGGLPLWPNVYPMPGIGDHVTHLEDCLEVLMASGQACPPKLSFLKVICSMHWVPTRHWFLNISLHCKTPDAKGLYASSGGPHQQGVPGHSER